MAGVDRSIAMVRAEGLVLGLATSSAPPLIDAVLTKLGLMDAFAVMHSAIEEELGKPHPAVFLTTAQLLDVEPAECVAIEDSVAGVRSFDEPGYDDADLKLESLEELTPEMLG
jgi:sugar-phosphatase